MSEKIASNGTTTRATLSVADQEKIIKNSEKELTFFTKEVVSAVGAALITLNSRGFPRYVAYELGAKTEAVRNEKGGISFVLKAENSFSQGESQSFIMKDVLHVEENSSAKAAPFTTALGGKLQTNIVRHLGNSWIGQQAVLNGADFHVVPGRAEVNYEVAFTIKRTKSLGLEISFLSSGEGGIGMAKENSSVHYIKVKFYTDADAEEAKKKQSTPPIA